MIEASPELKQRFRTRDHIKTIQDLANQSALRIKTFDVNILSRHDPVHRAARRAASARAQSAHAEGAASDPRRAGEDARGPADHHDDAVGRHPGRRVQGRAEERAAHPRRPFPRQGFPPAVAGAVRISADAIGKHRERWGDPANWPLVMPNLGRSCSSTACSPTGRPSRPRTTRRSASGPASISTSRWASA